MAVIDIEGDARRAFEVMDKGGIAILPQSVGYSLIAAHPGLLAPSAGALALSPQRSAVLEEGRLAFVDFDWTIGGIPVEGAGVFARLNAGNVIQLGTRLLVVTPGIRPAENRPKDDQKRTVDVAQAFANGADYIVVGRPVRDAPDPRAAGTVPSTKGTLTA